jgi:hypothetical protein
MAGLIQDDTDLEMTRYNEAAHIKQYSGLSANTMRGGTVRYDPIRKVDEVYVDLPSGGKLRVGDRPVQTAQADILTTQTDATAAAPAALVPTATPAPVSLRPTAAPVAARQPIAEYAAEQRTISDNGPTAADFEAAGYTAEELAQYQQSLPGPEMVPIKMTPAQMAEYAKQPDARFISDYEQPGFFDGAISETIKGLVRGGIVEPAKFVNEMLGDTRSTFFQLVNPKTGEFEPRIMVVSAEEMANIMKMPFAPVGLDDLLKSSEQAGTGAQIAGGVGQFVGAFAGVGKLFKIGKGLLGAATQSAAADFLGFGGNDGRLTDVLLELGVPENRITDFLRTDPNDPDYVGRFKNALEGAVLGGLVDQIAPVFRLIKDGGSATALGQAIGDLRFKAQQTSSNLLSDAIGVGRAVAAGDTRMLGEIFQPAGTPRSLGAAGVNDATMQSAPLAPIPSITPRDLEGARIIPTVADLMRTGGYYTGIDASKVDVPEPMMGGPGYPLLQSSQQAGLAWAIQGKSIGTKKAGSGADLIAVTAMNPTSHQSNISFINSLIKTTSAYVRDGRIQPEILGELDARVRTSATGGDPSLARLERFPGFNSPNLQEFINSASFQERSRIADIIGSKGMQEQGLPNVARVLQETVDPRYAGANPRDTLLFIEPDFSAPPVDLTAAGLPVHPSYRYGIRGRVFGALDQNISTFEMFPDFWGEKNVNAFGPAFNTGGRRAFDMALPIQKVTGKQVDDLERILQTTSGSGPRLSPIDTRIVVNSMLDKWKLTTKAITAGGASPQAFVDAITNSKYRPALTSYSADDIKAGAKSGNLVAYQLGDDDVFFAIDAKPDYSWAGVDMMPGDKALVGVVSNAPGAKGTAVPSVMAKAIESGITVLDAFAVPSKRFPDGYLPEYYGEFGFQEVGRVPFNKEMYIADHGEQDYKDLLEAWKSDGWDESMGMPPVIVMRWSGSDADRAATAAGIRGAGAPSHRAETQGFVAETEGLAGRVSDSTVQQETPSIGSGNRGEAGTDNRTNLSSRAREAAKSLLGLTPEQLRNRGIPESQIQQLMQRRQ